MRSRSSLAPVLAVLVALVVCLAPTSALALVQPMDFGELSKAADAVVVGTAIGSSSHYADSSSPFAGLIVTDTKFKVESVADGKRPQIVIVTQPGGAVGDLGLKVDNYPQFSTGETCVLFLDAQNEVVGGYQGKLRVERDRVSQYGISTGELGGKVRGARRGQHVPRRPELPGALSPSTSASLLSMPAASAEQGAVSATAAAALSVIISSVSPTKAIAGVEYVAITGSGFGATRGTGAVEFTDGLNLSGGLRPATNIVSWSDTSIVCQVPSNAASGPLYVLSNANSLDSYTYDTSFSTGGFTWGTKPATYRINEGAPMVGEATQIQAAMATWNAVSSNFQLGYSPTPVTAGPYPPSGTDGVNSIQFAPLSSGALAMSANWYYTSTSKFVESDIFFDSNRTWGSTASAGVYDLQSIALHELGHTAGLDDQYPNTWRVMGAYTGANKRALSADEIEGISYLYPRVRTPTVSSATHPFQTDYYPSTSASLAYTSASPEGIKGYAFSLDEFPSSDPGSVVATTSTTAQFAGLAPGDHYFHVRAFSNLDVKSPVAHFRVRVAAAPVQLAVYRFYNVKNGSHFYTATEAEKDNVIASLSAIYNFEGPAYSLNTASLNNRTPLHRFYNKKNGSHFYTSSEAEKNSVVANLSSTFLYEGPVWGVCTTQVASGTRVYRFFNRKNGSHFYTISTAERNDVMNRLSTTYTYEGVAYSLATF